MKGIRQPGVLARRAAGSRRRWRPSASPRPRGRGAPVNTTPPTITGTAKVGSDPDRGRRDVEQCARPRSRTSGCAATVAATPARTSPTAPRSLHARRRGCGPDDPCPGDRHEPDGSASAQSDQTAAVEPATSTAAPKNTAAPTITGTPKVGQVADRGEGSWSGNPTASPTRGSAATRTSPSCSNVVGATARPTASGRRSRLPAPGLGHRPERQGQRHRELGDHRDRRAGRADHERRPDDHDHLDPLRRADRLRALPDLRRLQQEPHDPRHRLASRGRVYTRRFTTLVAAAAVWRLHPSLDSRPPLPRPRPATP